MLQLLFLAFPALCMCTMFSAFRAFCTCTMFSAFPALYLHVYLVFSFSRALLVYRLFSFSRSLRRIHIISFPALCSRLHASSPDLLVCYCRLYYSVSLKIAFRFNLLFLPLSVRAHIDFLSDVDDSPKRPRCTAKIKNNLHTFSSLQVYMGY